MLDAELPIGMFDSGVGGLTVLKALETLLPNEDYLYLGDTARVPYGTKSPETIVRYTLMAAARLVDFGVKALIIACNTATSAALPEAAAKFAPLPVLGVIGPGAQAATGATRNGHIGVIATEATISGGAYQREIKKLSPQAQVSTKACTLLVPLAEEGILAGPIAEGIINYYLDSIFDSRAHSGPDTLLLGCTHFPLFQKTLQKIAGPDITIVDSASATAIQTQKSLARANLLNSRLSPGHACFLTTDHRERFARTGSLFLERELKPEEIELVDL